MAAVDMVLVSIQAPGFRGFEWILKQKREVLKMVKVYDHEGTRTKTGFHTGYSVWYDIKRNEYIVSMKSGSSHYANQAELRAILVNIKIKGLTDLRKT
jgi:hypothetical protein